MRIRLLTITHKVPAWIEAGYQEYVKRLPANCVLEIVEIPAEKRSANADLNRVCIKEGEKMLAAIKREHYVIALDVKGKPLSTEALADALKQFQQEGRTIDLLVGGPEGLAPACLARANEKWSLSALTFPHFIVRVIMAEQIYRAMSILQNHPYHR